MNPNIRRCNRPRRIDSGAVPESFLQQIQSTPGFCKAPKGKMIRVQTKENVKNKRRFDLNSENSYNIRKPICTLITLDSFQTAISVKQKIEHMSLNVHIDYNSLRNRTIFKL